MNRERILDLVLEALRQTNRGRLPDQQLEVSPTAPVFGPESSLNSMGLVTLVIDLEDLLAAEGYDVLLSDARAMSQARSPFRDVPALVEFIAHGIAEKS